MKIFFFSPQKIITIKNKISPWIGAACLVFLSVGVWHSLVLSPADYQQGEAVRIMYVHVPASWMAVLVYLFMATCAVLGFILQHPLCDLIVKSSAPIGLCFTLISLMTGSLWGKPMWGTWWVWDARLTSVLILLFLYIGYLGLVRSHDDPARGLKFGSILVMIGAINIPIIKWSVTWWSTLHQPASLLRKGGSAIHESMLWPLGLMMLAYVLFFLWTMGHRLELEIIKRRIWSNIIREKHKSIIKQP